MMSWANLAAKSSSLFLLLPLVVGKLPPRDSVIWFAVATLFTFQLVVDFGLTPTISRYVAYANGGVPLADLVAGRKIATLSSGLSQPDWTCVAFLYANLRAMYKVVASVMFAVGVILSTGFMEPAIAGASEPGWTALAVLTAILVAVVNVYGNSYVSLLQGCGQIALVQRVQMSFAFVSVAAGSISLALSHSVALAILAFYLPNLLCVVGLRLRAHLQLQKVITKLDFSDAAHQAMAAQIRRQMGRDSVKSGIGTLASLGIIQLSGLVVTRMMEPAIASAYMMGLQMVRAANGFSQAPFYAHLPNMAALYSDLSTHPKLLKIAGQGMIKSLGVFIAVVLAAGFVLFEFAQLFGNRQLPSLYLLGLLGLAFLLERFGAMQLQLYTLTGDVIWHRANGFTALIIIVSALPLFLSMRAPGLVVAMILGYGLFYVPYCTFKAHRAFNMPLAKQWALLVAGVVVCIMFMLTRVHADVH